MARPDPGHEARTRRGLRDMAGGTLDGLLEIPAPLYRSHAIRLSRLAPARMLPEPELCLRPYEDYDTLQTASPVTLPDGRVLAAMTHATGGGQYAVRLATYPSEAEFLSEVEADTDEVFLDGLQGDSSNLRDRWPQATVSRAGGRTWLVVAWAQRNGDERAITRLYERNADGSWSTVQTLRDEQWDSAIHNEFRLTPMTGRVHEHGGFLFVMAFWPYVRGSDWVANHWGLWRSADGGDSWDLMTHFRNGVVGGPYTNAIGRNLTSFDGALWAATSDDYGGARNRLRYSDDNGETWHVAFNRWALPWEESEFNWWDPEGDEELFWGFAVIETGVELAGFFTGFSGSTGSVVWIGGADEPRTGIETWTEIDVFDCGVRSLDAQCYEIDGRIWFEHMGVLTEYIPGIGAVHQEKFQ